MVPPDEDIRREALALKEDAGRLTAALDAVSESPSLLIVDRFEEVFAEECLQSDQAAFANSLADLVRSKRGHRLVLILDSEFASETKKLGPLAELFERATFDVPLLSAGDLREIIVRPAELVGLHIDPAVVDRLVNDVTGDPSALALVQYALEWLWKKRTGNRIPASAYDELGSAQRAFSLAADAIFLQMHEDQRRSLAKCFCIWFGWSRAAAWSRVELRARICYPPSPGHPSRSSMRCSSSWLGNNCCARINQANASTLQPKAWLHDGRHSCIGSTRSARAARSGLG